MRISAILVMIAACTVHAWAADPLFSGPQVGEQLPNLPAVYALDEQAGKAFDLRADVGDHPLLLVFVHELTRPSVAMTRVVASYAASRSDEGLHSGVIFLSDDVSEMTAVVKRARHALPRDAPIGISVDGQEGPGAYGLNRKAALTILVAKEGVVTANFALVQPSVAADAPRVGAAIAAVLGDEKKPSLADMQGPGNDAPMASDDGRFRALLRPVIDKQASSEDVDLAAKRVEAAAEQDAALRQRVGEVARRIIGAGRLSNYGAERAQEYLRKWAEEYAAEETTPATDSDARDDK